MDDSLPTNPGSRNKPVAKYGRARRRTAAKKKAPQDTAPEVEVEYSEEEEDERPVPPARQAKSKKPTLSVAQQAGNGQRDGGKDAQGYALPPKQNRNKEPPVAGSSRAFAPSTKPSTSHETPRPTLGDKSNARAKPRPQVVVPVSRSTGTRPAAKPKLQVYAEPSEPSQGQDARRAPTMTRAQSTEARSGSKEAVPSLEKREQAANPDIVSAAADRKLSTRRTASVPNITEARQRSMPDVAGPSARVTAPSQPEPLAAEADASMADVAPLLPGQTGSRQQGLQPDETFPVDRTEIDAALKDYSNITAVEGPSDMVIEDSRMDDVVMQDNVVVGHDDELPDADDHIAAASRQDGVPQSAKSKRTRSVSVPLGPVEKGRGWKRKLDEAAEPVTAKVPKASSSRTTAVVRKSKTAQADRKADPESPPSSPRRRAGPSRPTNVARRVPTGGRKVKAKARKGAGNDDGGLAEAMQRSLSIEHKKSSVRDNSIPGHEGYDDTYSSPPGASSIPGTSAAVEQKHRGEKKPRKARVADEAKVTKSASQPKWKKSPMPTTIAKEAPVLGDSESSDDPMAI